MDVNSPEMKALAKRAHDPKVQKAIADKLTGLDTKSTPKQLEDAVTEALDAVTPSRKRRINKR